MNKIARSNTNNEFFLINVQLNKSVVYSTNGSESCYYLFEKRRTLDGYIVEFSNGINANAHKINMHINWNFFPRIRCHLWVLKLVLSIETPRFFCFFRKFPWKFSIAQSKYKKCVLFSLALITQKIEWKQKERTCVTTVSVIFHILSKFWMEEYLNRFFLPRNNMKTYVFQAMEKYFLFKQWAFVWVTFAFSLFNYKIHKWENISNGKDVDGKAAFLFK